MNPTEMIFRHGQRVRYIGDTQYPKGLTGTVSLTGGGYGTRYIVTVLWDADEKGVSYGTQSVVKELLEPIPATEAVLTEVTPTPTAPPIEE